MSGAVLIGFGAAVLAGMFGIGGAGVTTPAIRVLLGVSPAIALGTTLPVTIPTAAIGGFIYSRSGLVQRRVSGFCSLGGVFGASGGALLTRVIDLHYLMLLTGALVLYVSASTFLRGVRGAGLDSDPVELPSRIESADGDCDADAGPGGSALPECPVGAAPLTLVAIGLAAGLLSGLIGVGGGIVLIPAFVYILKMPLKTSFGTSLAVITVTAVPGTVIHSLLGHIYWPLALYLAAGSTLGAVVGARITIRVSERVIYMLFGLLLASFGIIFIVNEIAAMTG